MCSRGPLAFLLAFMVGSAAVSSAQTPVPFPRPGQPASPPAQKPPATPPAQKPPAEPLAPAPTGEPSESTLGAPLYPGAQLITSYDAGRGQRYYLFGTNTPFADIVAYYKTTLKQRGELVFEAPATHMFEIGRFREETMAFPPSVTVKDYTWGGSQGYLNPKRGAKPARFTTIIQIVPVPPGATR
jgi:hypothetical protein